MCTCVYMHVHINFIPPVTTGTISVKDLSDSLSIPGGSMIGEAVADGEGMVLVTVALDGVVPVGQSIRKNNIS